MSIRNIAQGGLLICLSSILQLLPASLGEISVIATIFNAIPIYILSRLNPKAGLAGYIIAGVLIFLFNSHEGIFFLFTNGIVGFSLGTINYRIKSKMLISLLSGIVLAFSLSILNFIVGIPILGVNLPGNLIIQISILLALYIIIYKYIILLIKNTGSLPPELILFIQFQK